MIGFLKQANSDLLASALHALTNNVMVADKDYRIVYMNPAVRTLLKQEQESIRESFPDFDVDKLIGRSIDEFHKKPAHQRSLLEGLTEKHTATIRIGGTTFDLVANHIVRGGKRVGTVVEWADAAARIFTVENASKMEALARSQAIIEFDMDGTILTANDNFLNALGYTLEEVTGKKHAIFVDPSERESEEYRRFWEKLRAGEFQSAEYRRIGKKGNDVWIQATYNPVFDAQGKPYKVVKFATDITQQVEERRRRREIQRQIDADLNEIVGAVSRTAEQATSSAATSSTTADSVQTVAAATEELVASIQEISRQVKTALDISQRAVDEAGKSSEIMSGLSEDAKTIGNVIELIDSIANQTNLLALNATIEAARAGEAGKGFAVVASEVKSLASQTSKATEDISAQVQSVQTTTENAVHAIEAVLSIINQISEISENVASGVEEQSSVTAEISRSMVTASEGVATLTANMTSISAATAQIDGATRKVREASASVV